MTTPTGTKTKSFKAGFEYAPAEIRDNTKARRAWLANRLAALHAESDIDRVKTKIMGGGSMQEISIWRTKEIQGRLRHCGMCQFCGAVQVVKDNGLIVLHGYTRPGYGYVVGECPAQGRAPLNTEKTLTEAYLVDFTAKVPGAQQAASRAKIAMEKATAARDASREPRYTQRPEAPKQTGFDARFSKLTWEERVAKFEKEMAEWMTAHPLTNKLHAATAKWQDARNWADYCTQMKARFEEMLASNVHGSPLTPEVV